MLEVILLSLRGRAYTPAELASGYLVNQVRDQPGQRGTQTGGQPLRLGHLALYAWRWKTLACPVSYGVRIMRYDGDEIALHLRYAVRPWETEGEGFAWGY